MKMIDEEEVRELVYEALVRYIHPTANPEVALTKNYSLELPSKPAILFKSDGVVFWISVEKA